jgi:CRISPR system Cascade subunit CasD
VTDFLLFTLYSPLSSWGEIAVGEARGSWDRPSRSAVLGFVAAALGLVREERDGHAALDDGYGVAVRLDAAGAPLGDYHTAQTVSASLVKKRRPSTRAELLATRDRETILSRRVYRQDALATIAMWARGEARWPLGDLADALRRPAFVLYAGRKANPLGLPADPEVLSAPTLAAALAHRTHDRARHAGFALERLDLARVTEVSCDADALVDSGMLRMRSEIRRDSAPERERWQFAERVVDVFALERVSGVGGKE